MEKEKLLSEERYLKGKKKITIAAFLIFIIGMFIGGCLIFKGISIKNEVNSTYSEENKKSKIADLNKKIDQEKTKLEAIRQELEIKGIKYNEFADYIDGEVYDLYIVTKVLSPSFSRCSFDEFKNNSLTKEYCSLKNELKETELIDVDFERGFKGSNSLPFYMFGAFIIIVTCMISGVVYSVAKRRDILAFSTQQVMPVVQEGMEQMAPTVGKVVEQMAPAVGKAAGEIAKGIKNGLKDEDEK